MSDDWCRLVERRLDEINDRMIDLSKQQSDIIKIVVVGLLAIAGAVVGVNTVT